MKSNLKRVKTLDMYCSVLMKFILTHNIYEINFNRLLFQLLTNNNYTPYFGPSPFLPMVGKR